MNGKVILFVCPNKDSWHEDNKTVYLLVPGYSFHRHKKEDAGEETLWSYFLRMDPESFVMIDDPSEAMETGILGSLRGETLRYPHVCPFCRARGVKS